MAFSRNLARLPLMQDRKPIAIGAERHSAVAHDIVGQERGKDKMDAKNAEEVLRARLDELLDRSKVIEEDLRHPLEADSEEQAVDLADDEALAGVDEVLKREIAAVRLALLRIERGEYGSCAACGEDIAEKRLEALPTATLCIKCAA
jgi:DnaK suppressor protein